MESITNSNDRIKILATDTVILAKPSRSIQIFNIKGSFEDVAEAVMEYMDNRKLMSADVCIIAGSENITPKYNKLDKNIPQENKAQLATEIADELINKINIFQHYLEKRDSRLIVASLIPCPRDQDYVKSNVDEAVQEIVSEAFVLTNDKIFNMMKERGLIMPDIKRYAQVSNKKYKYRRQHKIRIAKYQEDLVHPTADIATLMINMSIKALMGRGT